MNRSLGADSCRPLEQLFGIEFHHRSALKKSLMGRSWHRADLDRRGR